MPPPDLSAVPTAQLVETLKGSGYDVPDGLPEEIVRRGRDAIEPLSAIARDGALWEAPEPRGYMAPMHAVHLLGAIGGAASRAPNEWQTRAAGPAPPGRSPAGTKVGRNDPCPCGSGKKYKKCCMP